LTWSLGCLDFVLCSFGPLEFSEGLFISIKNGIIKNTKGKKIKRVIFIPGKLINFVV